MTGFGKETQPVHDRVAERQREGIRKELERIADAVELLALVAQASAEAVSPTTVAMAARIARRESARDQRGRR